MDDVKKSAIRLTHWIDHNLDHLKGYDEMAQVLEKEGVIEAAKHVRKGMGFIEEANAAFVKALSLLSKEDDKAPCSREAGAEEHKHSHVHDHSHEHSHDHEHCHDHGHPHEHDGHGHDHSHGEKDK